MARPEPLVAIDLGGKPTKNPVLIALNDTIRRYNLVFPTLANQQQREKNFLIDAKAVGYLDSIFLHCIAYIVMRPMSSRSARGEGRVHAVAQTTLAVKKHAKFFNIRFLRGDLDASKEGSMNYWLERYDQKLIGEDIFYEFLSWAETSTEKQSFREYQADAVSDLQYFTELNREKYEVHFNGQMILDIDGNPLNTDGEGSFSGLGDSFIYVCSARTRKIYTAASERGVVHHSSFLRGEPIIAGGDWIVYNGRLKFLNAASGHYRPTTGNMQLFLQMFRGQLDGNAFIQPTYQGPVYKIRDYVRLGDSATPSAEGKQFVDERTGYF
ncbi:MAG: hypothetical protein DCF30_16535 [Hyphomicrobiales bacterium]|nr:MAG: hypothetical protein DCF30_16535 [Hyphomicrobiales bacterium]